MSPPLTYNNAAWNPPFIHTAYIYLSEWCFIRCIREYFTCLTAQNIMVGRNPAEWEAPESRDRTGVLTTSEMEDWHRPWHPVYFIGGTQQAEKMQTLIQSRTRWLFVSLLFYTRAESCIPQICDRKDFPYPLDVIFPQKELKKKMDQIKTQLCNILFLLLPNGQFNLEPFCQKFLSTNKLKQTRIWEKHMP